jgi:hypothetical protein
MEARASIFTLEQEAQLRDLKRHLPFRIVWGCINPKDQSFEAHASYTRAKLNARLRKGWLVATVHNS